MAIEFKPGAFEPVISVTPRGDGYTRAFHGDKQGLFDASRDTFRVAFASSQGLGSNLTYTRACMDPLSKILAQFLWARNLSNQLSQVGLNNRFAKELNTDFPLPEPVVKLFNAYGHVHHEEVNYVQLSLEREYAKAIIDLLDMIKNTNFDDEDNLAVDDIPDNGWRQLLALSPTGEIEIRDTQDMSQYLTNLLSYINARAALNPEQRLRYSKTIIDCATERDLRTAFSWLRNQPGVGNLPRRGRDEIPAEFRERMQTIFGENAPVNIGTVLNSKHITKAIRRTTEALRVAIDEIFNTVALARIPKYEKGSLAQLAETNSDDLTFTHFPLSMADLTICAAFKVGKVLRRFLRAAPEQTDSTLRGDLIRKSVRRRT